VNVLKMALDLVVDIVGLIHVTNKLRKVVIRFGEFEQFYNKERVPLMTSK